MSTDKERPCHSPRCLQTVRTVTSKRVNPVSSYRLTGRPSKRNKPAIPLIRSAYGVVRIASTRPAEFGQARERAGARPGDDIIPADLDPGVRDHIALLTSDTEAHPARYAAAAQHRMRGQRPRQTKRFTPRFLLRRCLSPIIPSRFRLPRSGPDSARWPSCPCRLRAAGMTRTAIRARNKLTAASPGDKTRRTVLYLHDLFCGSIARAIDHRQVFEMALCRELWFAHRRHGLSFQEGKFQQPGKARRASAKSRWPWDWGLK